MPVLTSDLKSADAVICAKPCTLVSATVLTDGTNAATLVLYDNASSAAGTVLAKVKVAGANLMGFVVPLARAEKGIYADVTGTGAEFVITYEP